jgi:hypothetical protein
MKQITFVLLLFIVISCSSDDVNNYYFTDSERALLVYNIGDSFSLLREPQIDTLVLVFTEIIRDTSSTSALGLLYHNTESYDATFKHSTSIFGGIYAFKEPNFMMTIAIKVENFETEFEGSLCDTLYNHTINNKEYPELYVFAEEKGQKPMLYFTKDEGIVYIDSTASGNSYTLIEYIKGGE